jgi:hypothetical protein
VVALLTSKKNTWFLHVGGKIWVYFYLSLQVIEATRPYVHEYLYLEQLPKKGKHVMKRMRLIEQKKKTDNKWDQFQIEAQ